MSNTTAVFTADKRTLEIDRDSPPLVSDATKTLQSPATATANFLSVLIYGGGFSEDSALGGAGIESPSPTPVVRSPPLATPLFFRATLTPAKKTEKPAHQISSCAKRYFAVTKADLRELDLLGLGSDFSTLDFSSSTATCRPICPPQLTGVFLPLSNTEKSKITSALGAEFRFLQIDSNDLTQVEAAIDLLSERFMQSWLIAGCDSRIAALAFINETLAHPSKKIIRQLHKCLNSLFISTPFSNVLTEMTLRALNSAHLHFLQWAVKYVPLVFTSQVNRLTAGIVLTPSLTLPLFAKLDIESLSLSGDDEMELERLLLVDEILSSLHKKLPFLCCVGSYRSIRLTARLTTLPDASKHLIQTAALPALSSTSSATPLLKEAFDWSSLLKPGSYSAWIVAILFSTSDLIKVLETSWETFSNSFLLWVNVNADAGFTFPSELALALLFNEKISTNLLREPGIQSHKIWNYLLASLYNETVARLLIEQEASHPIFRAQTHAGQTFLHMAYKYGHWKAAEDLRIFSKADYLIEDRFSKTPIHYAIDRDDVLCLIANFQKDNGHLADEFLNRFFDGLNILQYSVKNSKLSCCQFLAWFPALMAAETEHKESLISLAGADSAELSWLSELFFSAEDYGPTSKGRS